MRRFVLCLIVILGGCSDPGLRDRSLMNPVARLVLPRSARVEKQTAKWEHERPRASVVGLVADPMARLYPANHGLVVRFADLSTLQRHALPHLRDIAALLPGLGLPELPPGTLLRVRAGLPDEITVDRIRPFALVHTKEGVVALIPVKGEFANKPNLRRLDEHYCIAGRKSAVAHYRPAMRAGHYLAGDISVVAPRNEIAGIGERLQQLAAVEGVTLPIPAELLSHRPHEVERADLALRFSPSGVRLDLRLSPDTAHDGALSVLLSSLRARPSGALQFLPADGVATFATTADVPTWLALLSELAKAPIGRENPAAMTRITEACAVLGADAALTVLLPAGHPATLVLVSELAEPDREAAAAFLESDAMTPLVELLSGSGGSLKFKRGVFKRHGAKVATITGTLDPEVAKTLRASRGLCPMLARFAQGPVTVYVALVGQRLCIVAGERSRPELERLIDRIVGKHPAADQRSAESPQTLLRRSALLARVDLAPLLAPDSGSRLPLTLGVAVEGGALRVAALLPDFKLAAALNRLGLFATPKQTAPSEQAPSKQD